jgi:hypothetical protein
MQKPLCFILMPFGKKPGAGGAIIDFDAVYGELIKPAVEAAGLVPLRADEEQAGVDEGRRGRARARGEGMRRTSPVPAR